MNTVSPRIITEQVREFHPDTKLLLALLNLRRVRPLTEKEQVEYEEVSERCDRRIALQMVADLSHDRATEARSFPEDRINFHD